MARRISRPSSDEGRLGPIEIRIGDATVRAYQNENLVAAAFASGTQVLSRSIKYHRPRSFFCLGGHCSGCLVRLNGVPNVRACLQPCRDGLEVAGQNAFPSAEVDLLGAVDFLFSRGLDHHTLMTGSSVLNRLANKVVRQLSGLGRLPDAPAKELPDVTDWNVDVCVIGGGAAGLAAAKRCAERGVSLLVIDDGFAPGGSMAADPQLGPDAADTSLDLIVSAGGKILPRSTAIGYFPEDDGGVLAVSAPEGLHRVKARSWIWATGGYPVNLPFAENDRPGVIAARAVGRLLIAYGVLAGERICLVEVPELAAECTALANALARQGADVIRVPLAEVVGARGRSWVSGLDTTRGRIDCDLVAVAALPAPASEGARQQGCKVVLDPAAGGFKIAVDADGRTSAAGVWACGDVTGYMGPARAIADGARVAANALAALG